jgi:hypothetical protein
MGWEEERVEERVEEWRLTHPMYAAETPMSVSIPTRVHRWSRSVFIGKGPHEARSGYLPRVGVP